MNQLFSKKHYLNIKKKVNSYHRFLFKEIQSELKNFDSIFINRLKVIFKIKSLRSYSPLKFFWLQLIEDYFWLINNSDEDELFSYWEKSEYCEAFFKLINNNLSILDSSKKMLSNIEMQILSFFYLHLSDRKVILNVPLSYKVIPEIGDFENRIYLSEKHHFINFSKRPKTFPFISVNHVLKNSKIQKNDLRIFNKTLYLIPTNKEGIKRFNEFKKRIESALSIIKKYSPDSYKTFLSFTHTILPINEPGIVSYSLQNLPGYSCINLFERDFIDLMDDLIHENSHHFLNAYLNSRELLNEDDEKIYYSPWRNSLRPIRGIYHAVFTFFWALHLFGNLYRSLDKATFFTPVEKEKITTRFVEEYYMLNYCLPDLKHAFKHKKINSDGMKLIKEIYSQIKLFKKDISKIKDNKGLKDNLEEKRKKYLLS